MEVGGWASPVQHPPKCGLGSPPTGGELERLEREFAIQSQITEAARRWPVTPMSAKN